MEMGGDNAARTEFGSVTFAGRGGNCGGQLINDLLTRRLGQQLCHRLTCGVHELLELFRCRLIDLDTGVTDHGKVLQFLAAITPIIAKAASSAAFWKAVLSSSGSACQ